MVNNAYIGMPNFHMSHLSKTKANINKGAINVAKANITTVFKDKLGICFLYIAHAIPIRKIGAYKRTFCSITPTAKCPPIMSTLSIYMVLFSFPNIGVDR